MAKQTQPDNLERSCRRHASWSPSTNTYCELPRDLEQEELYEFGRWARAAIPIGAGHNTFHITSYYGPPRGDLIGNSYADKLLRLLFECSRDFGSQLPAAICCDLNRDPNECAYLKGGTRQNRMDRPRPSYGRGNEALPTYYQFGAAQEAISGHGCTRIDLA